MDDPAASAGHDGHGASDGTAAGPAAGSGGRSGGTYGILAAGLLVGLTVGVGIDGWLIVRAIRRNAAKAGARSTRAAATKVPVASAK